MSGIENLWYNGIKLDGGSRDFSAMTDVTMVTFDNPYGMHGGAATTIKTGSGQKVGLTQVNGLAATDSSTVNLDGASDLTVNGIASKNTTGTVTVDIESASVSR